LTEPSQDTVHNVTFGETIMIKCSATGHPSPTVSLSHDEKHRSVVLHESLHSVQTNFIAHSSEKFYCTARNNYVNEVGVIEKVERKASITVIMTETVL
jgi:hypothetical protein